MSAEGTNLLRLAQLRAAISEPTRSCHSEESLRRALENLVNRDFDVNYRIPATELRDGNESLADCTSLHIAALADSPLCVEVLLGRGADIVSKDASGRTALHRALDVFRPGEDFDDRASSKDGVAGDGSTSARTGKRNGRRDVWRAKGQLPRNDTVNRILSAHIDRGVPSNPACEDGLSHFHVACMVNHGSAIDFFLRSGVSANLRVIEDSPVLAGYTGLHLAARYSNHEAMALLLERGADPSLRDAESKTPLDLLVERNMELADSVIEGTSDCAAARRSREQNESLIELVLREAGERDFRERYGLPALHAACALSDPSVAKRLLESEPDGSVSLVSDSPAWPRYTALHFAAHFSVRTVKLLVRRSASLTAEAANGVTPLDLCSERFSPSEVHSILSADGACKEIRLSGGSTGLLDLIKAMEDVDEFRDFLKSSGCINEAIGEDSPIFPGCTPLHLAVAMSGKSMHLWENWLRTSRARSAEGSEYARDYSRRMKRKYRRRIVMCLKLRTDANIPDSRGLTPLHAAFYQRRRKVVRLLLESCSRETPTQNPRDPHNVSHFHIACLAGKKKVAKRFLLGNVDVDEPIGRAVEWFRAIDRKSAGQAESPSGSIWISSGSTALHFAVILEKEALMKMLLKSGADLYARDSQNLTPVHRIMANPKEDNFYTSARSMIDDLADLRDCRDNAFNLSHLHVACFVRSDSAVRRLLARGVDTEIRITNDASSSGGLYAADRYIGFKPFELFGITGDFISFALGKTIMELGGDAHAGSPEGRSLFQRFFNSFYRSSVLSKRVICQVLQLDENSTTDVDEAGLTMLHLACFYLEVDSVQRLLKKDANVNRRIREDSGYDWAGFTPLHCLIDAIEHRRDKVNFNDVKCILVLLELYKADVTIRNARGLTPVHMASYLPERSETCEELGCPRLVPFLVSRLMSCHADFQLNPVDDRGISHFHVACTNDAMADRVEGFLERGNVDASAPTNLFAAARPELKCQPGYTPLHLAVAHRCRSVTRLLLECGADVRAEDFHGDTPLHVARRTSFPHADLVDRMLSLGAADANSENVAGLTPLDRPAKSTASSASSSAPPAKIGHWSGATLRLRKILSCVESFLSFDWFTSPRRRRLSSLLDECVDVGKRLRNAKVSRERKRYENDDILDSEESDDDDDDDDDDADDDSDDGDADEDDDLGDDCVSDAGDCARRLKAV